MAAEFRDEKRGVGQVASSLDQEERMRCCDTGADQSLACPKGATGPRVAEESGEFLFERGVTVALGDEIESGGLEASDGLISLLVDDLAMTRRKRALDLGEV